MDKIASFTVNHLDLLAGVYVSRKDKDQDTGAVVTTFDLRMKEPNREPVMNTGECHTLEHLGATYLRNDPQWSDKVVYFGPMGCRTGFYLVLFGDYSSEDILDLLKGLFGFCATYEGEIPGAAPEDCGNYLDQNLPMARLLAQNYLDILEHIDESRMVYPAKLTDEEGR